MQDGETPQQVATSLANRQAYLRAVNDLQDGWRRFYAEGHKWAMADVAEATGFALVRARRQWNLCQSLQAQPPVVQVNIAVLHMWLRRRTQRFYQCSSARRSRALRSGVTSPPITCWRRILRLRATYLTFIVSQRTLTLRTHLSWQVRDKKVSAHIRALHQNPGLDDAECGDWQDAGETAAQRDVREANRQGYLQGVADLRELWRATNTEAAKVEGTAAGRTKGYERIRHQRAQALYLRLQNEPPAVQINVNMLNNAAQAEQAKLLPMTVRPQGQRRAYWRDSFSQDMLASHLESSRHVVESSQSRRGARQPPSCGTGPHPSIFDDVEQPLGTILRPGVTQYDWPSGGKWQDRSRKAYAKIRRIHEEFGMDDEAEFGDWQDVPIIRPATQASRDAPATSKVSQT
ncbi:hypothetical protein FB567DRAFT_614260 [Paraphoma chrysanthemicola]|uniref:Uncharacterized protein n=1 Tax=Paraphoma chrysanthemicola TaxID=798071 RepID=A0A8K0RDH2_9PLEO|nr:hypothetical protein FB567DRAFT_614260 [Paraphoma chrysanthemicola]